MMATSEIENSKFSQYQTTLYLVLEKETRNLSVKHSRESSLTERQVNLLLTAHFRFPFCKSVAAFCIPSTQERLETVCLLPYSLGLHRCLVLAPTMQAISRLGIGFGGKDERSGVLHSTGVLKTAGSPYEKIGIISRNVGWQYSGLYNVVLASKLSIGDFIRDQDGRDRWYHPIKEFPLVIIFDPTSFGSKLLASIYDYFKYRKIVLMTHSMELLHSRVPFEFCVPRV